MLYGASGGKAFINGVAGHRFGILLKGAQVVVEGTGDFACEYMTSGTVMILSNRHGKGIGTGASGGIIFLYDEEKLTQLNESLYIISEQEKEPYLAPIKSMLEEHLEKTNSTKAKFLLNNFARSASYFKVLIPIELEKINSLQRVIDVIKTYHLRKVPLTVGMQTWLEQKILSFLRTGIDPSIKNELRLLLPPNQPAIFSQVITEKLIQATKNFLEIADIENLYSPKISQIFSNDDTKAAKNKSLPLLQKRPVNERLNNLTGSLDTLLADALENINLYVSELNHQAQGCSGCRAQSCAGGEQVETGCPSGKSVNTMNTHLKKLGNLINGLITKDQWKILRQAFEVQIEESPFIAYTGAACPAPCQDACTETIPNAGVPNIHRNGKSIGEHVHIKDIEYYFYQIGRALGWFTGKKEWSDQQIASVFGNGSLQTGLRAKKQYDSIMILFKPPFHPIDVVRCSNQELIIVGSGPAGMQIAYQALRDGIKVKMYEKSDKPGGLLADGIPHHKFDKKYLTEDFAYLRSMGLELYLNSEVIYDDHLAEYKLITDPEGKSITNRNNDKQYLVLCIGTGQPKTLALRVTDQLNDVGKNHIVQAVDFLKAANNIAMILNDNPNMPEQEQNLLFQNHFGRMDPRHKKIVVIGGGDTAQDVSRWVARYFNQTGNKSDLNLNILVRGPELIKRGIKDAYPAPSGAPSEENKLRDEEIKYVNGDTFYLVEANKVVMDDNNKLNLSITKSQFKYIDLIRSDQQTNELFESLPRETRPIGEKTEVKINNVDMIICALGFESRKIEHNRPRVYIAGDAAGVEQTIIVGAQASGKNTYEQIRLAMGIPENRPTQLKGLLKHTLFSSTHLMKTSKSAIELNSVNNVDMKSSNSAPELYRGP